MTDTIYVKIFEQIKNELFEEKYNIKAETVYKETDTQLGYGSVIINQNIAINGIRIMKSVKNPGEFFLSLPQKQSKNGIYYNVCSMKQELYEKILSIMLKDLIYQKLEYNMGINIVEFKRYKSGHLIGIGKIEIDNILIHNVKLFKSADGQRYTCSFPQMNGSESRDLIYPIRRGLRERITQALVAQYYASP